MDKERINRKRLWVLITVIWCIGVSSYYFDPIIKGYEKSERALRYEGERNQARRFNQCLEENGTSYSKLLSENRDKCNESARNTCKGRGFWCAEKFLYQACIRTSSKECEHIYVLTSKHDVQEDTFVNRWKRHYKKAAYYMSKRYSKPLKIALLLFFGGPLILAFIPRAGASLIKWLTT